MRDVRLRSKHHASPPCSRLGPLRIALTAALVAWAASSGAHAAGIARTPVAVSAAATGPSDLGAWIATGEAERDPAARALRRPLRRGEAERAIALLVTDRLRAIAREDEGAVAAKTVAVGDRRMKWESRVFGEAPPGGHSLWISLHGGGNAPPAVNDGQWRNQIALYRPAEGI